MTEYVFHWWVAGAARPTLPKITLQAESHRHGAALALRQFAALGCDIAAPLAHVDIADPGDQMAGAPLCKLWGEFLFLFLEVVEFHLHEFTMIQLVVQSGEKLWTQTLLANFQRGLEALSLRLEGTDLRIAEWKHRANYSGVRA